MLSMRLALIVAYAASVQARTSEAFDDGETVSMLQSPVKKSSTLAHDIDDENPKKPAETWQGVLVGMGARTNAQVEHMSVEECRNTLIVELNGRTTASVPSLQSLGDTDLINEGRAYILFSDFKLCTTAELKQMSLDDVRNTLIVDLGKRTKQRPEELQKVNNEGLVNQWYDWADKEKTVDAILSFQWHPDQGKIAGTKPEFLEQQNYDNSDGIDDLHATFSVTKTVSNTYKFTATQGFKFSESSKTKAGVPGVAEEEVTIGAEQSFSFGEESDKTTTQTYTLSVPVTVQSHKKKRVSAVVQQSNLDVPYSARIQNANGEQKDITGTWYGVTTYNIDVKQEDIK